MSLDDRLYPGKHELCANLGDEFTAGVAGYVAHQVKPLEDHAYDATESLNVARLGRLDQRVDEVAGETAQQTLVEVGLFDERARREEARGESARVREAIRVQGAHEAHADQAGDVTAAFRRGQVGAEATAQAQASTARHHRRHG